MEGISFTRDEFPIRYKRIKKNKFQTVNIDLVNDIMNFRSRGEVITTYEADLKIYLKYTYWRGLKTEYDTIFFETTELIDGNINWMNNQ